MASGKIGVPRLRLAALVALGLLGCATAAPPPAAPKVCDQQLVTLNLYATPAINPSAAGRPRPVVVRLYQLRSDVRLENASYEDLLARDKEVLEGDLLKVDEVSVFPSERLEVQFERVKGAAFLAAVALFRSPKGTSWRSLYGFPPLPSDAPCGRRAGAPAPEVAPQAAFFLDATRVDDGTQFDESMFQGAGPVRRVALPRRALVDAPPPAKP